jgi:hypothetical protein
LPGVNTQEAAVRVWKLVKQMACCAFTVCATPIFVSWALLMVVYMIFHDSMELSKINFGGYLYEIM